jgi:hypothetical protein
MFRLLRFGLLGLVCAVPFAMPQASQAAAPAGIVRCRPAFTWARYHGCYRPYYGHVHFRR